MNPKKFGSIANHKHWRSSLVKYNKKTVTVVTEEGQRWNVSPHLLSKVKESKASGKKGKVVDLKSHRA